MSNKKIVVYSIGSIILASILGAGIYYLEDFNQAIETENLVTTTPLREIAIESTPFQQSPDSTEASAKTESKESETTVKLSDDQIKNLSIDIRSPQAGQILVTLSQIGKIVLHPDHHAHVLTPVSGIVVEARKNVGEYAKKGEVIAILDSKEVAQAKSDYLVALTQQNLALDVFNREARLFAKKITPEQDLLNAKATLESNRIQTELTKQKLLTLRLNNREIEDLVQLNSVQLSHYLIRAPIDGIITQRSLTKGQFVDEITPIYKLADLHVLWIETGVSPKNFYKLHEGQAVTVGLPGETHTTEGRVVHLNPIIEEDNIMAKAIIEIDNTQGNWNPGTYVNVRITTGKKDVPLLMPLEAIQKIDDQDCVFVQCEEGFEKKQVKLGHKDQAHAEIISGLTSQDRYAASGTFLLKAELNKNSAED